MISFLNLLDVFVGATPKTGSILRPIYELLKKNDDSEMSKIENKVKAAEKENYKSNEKEE